MIFITGMTRSGTSILTYFFLVSDLVTGFEPRIESFKKQLTLNDGVIRAYALRGGLEAFQVMRNKIARGDNFDVLKQPWLTLEVKRPPAYWLDKYHIKPDTVIITKRDITSLVESNLAAARSRKPIRLKPDELGELYRYRYKLLEQKFPAAIWLEFPRFIDDFEYLWGRIGHLVPNEKEEMKVKFTEVANAKYVRYREKSNE